MIVAVAVLIVCTVLGLRGLTKGLWLVVVTLLVVVVVICVIRVWCLSTIVVVVLIGFVLVVYA